MSWIYLSPHLDDVALSCGGLVWEQVQSGETVQIWTFCAGDPPPGPFSAFAEELHQRWQTGRAAMAARRAEDQASCQRLGAVARHFSIPDCIYRRSPSGGKALYASETALFDPPHPDEQDLRAGLSIQLARELPPEVQLVCPLALGGHTDHRLARAAVEAAAAQAKLRLWYYADYPYAIRPAAQEELARLQQAGWSAVSFPVSPAGLQAWGEAVAAHLSQISTFWPDLAAMRAALQAYQQLNQGVCLWKPPAVT